MPNPCTNQCTTQPTNPNTPPQPLPATHGPYCNRCHHQTENTLALAADIVEHVVAMAAPRITTPSDELSVQTSQGNESPAPIDVVALSAVDDLYAGMVFYARTFAIELGRPAPSPAMRSWRNARGAIQGLAAGVTPAAARYQIGVLAGWLSAHLSDIMAQGDPDIVREFLAGLRSIHWMQSQWPFEVKPRYSDMPHLVLCNSGKIAIYPPSGVGHAVIITCESCGKFWTEERYADDLHAFRMAQVARITRHLEHKYV